MNIAIFKNTFKRNYKLLVIFVVVMAFYLGTIISMIDPNNMKKIQELFATMEGYMGAFGISIADMTSPLNYTASVFFSIIVMAFTMVFYVIQANSLIGKTVDDTSISYTLSTPVKRTTIVITQGIYLIMCMFVLFAVILGVGSGFLSTFKDFKFDFVAYFNLVAITFCLCTAMAMLSFFLSVAFCGSKLGMWLAAGVPIGLIFMNMIGGAGGENTEWLKRVSPFGWLDSVGIVNGKVETWWMYIALIGAVIILFAGSIIVFNKKRLPI